MGTLLDQLLAEERLRNGGTMFPPNPAIAGAFAGRGAPGGRPPPGALRSMGQPAPRDLPSRIQALGAAPSGGQGGAPDLDAIAARAEAELARRGAQGGAGAASGGTPGRSFADIMAALRNAHAAGDTEAARRLARMAREAQQREEAMRLLELMEVEESLGEPPAQAPAASGQGGGQPAPTDAELEEALAALRGMQGQGSASQSYEEAIAQARALATEGRLDEARAVAQGAVDARRGGGQGGRLPADVSASLGAEGRALRQGTPIEVQLPNGTILQFPEGTADEVMSGAIERLILEEEAKQPGWSGYPAETVEMIRRRAVPIPGSTVPAGVDANAQGPVSPEMGSRMGDLLTARGQADRIARGAPGAAPAGDYEQLLALLQESQQRQDAARGLPSGPPMPPALPPVPTEPGFDANGLPIPAPGDIPAWAGAARVAAGEGVMPFAPGAPLPSNPQGMEWLGSWADDGNPDTMSRGEQVAAWLNNAGEAMTFGLLGDEAAGRFDELIGRGSAEERTRFYQDQEAQFWEQHPGDALSSEIGGGLVLPGQAAARFIGQGVGAAARMGRGLLAGAAGGAVHGTMEAEGDMIPMERGDFGQERRVGGVADRAMGGLLGAVTGGIGGAAITGIGQGFTRVAQALRGTPGAEEAVASVEDLKGAAQALYRAADASGVVVPQNRLSRLAADAERTIVSEGYRPRLHPRLAEALDELRELAQAPSAGLGRLELARRVVAMAARSTDADERRLGSLIIDRVDGLVDSLGEGSAPLRQARDLWSRMRRLERVEEIIEGANTAQNIDGGRGAFERALANGFRSFVRNPRNMRGFNEAERRLMWQIARGSAGVRALRGFAKLFAPDSIQGFATSLGAWTQAGPVSLALPAAGMGARAIANALVRSQARELPRMVGMTDSQRAITDALLRPYNALAPLAGGPPVQGLLSYLGAEPFGR